MCRHDNGHITTANDTMRTTDTATSPRTTAVSNCSRGGRRDGLDANDENRPKRCHCLLGPQVVFFFFFLFLFLFLLFSFFLFFSFLFHFSLLTIVITNETNYRQNHDDGQHHSTPNRCCEQLLVGWKRGATMAMGTTTAAWQEGQ